MHPLAWAGWAITVTVAVSLTRNPFYLSLILGSVLIVHLNVEQHHVNAAGWRGLLRLALGLTLLAIPFNALSAHVGQVVLFRLPATWPIIGGPITLEGVLWGVCSALALMSLMIAFSTFNLTVNQAQMLRLTPAFLYEVGLIISIALTFFPQMIAAAQEIQEAQRIRGHRMRRVRDMLPFVLALLTTGLEHSFQLAEALEARGFGARTTHSSHTTTPARILDDLFSLGGLSGVLCGFFLITWSASSYTVGWSILALSAAVLIISFWRQGHHTPRTRYHNDPWTWQDWATLTAGGLLVSAMLWGQFARPEILAYSPYMNILPPFHLWMGAVCLLPVVPALLNVPRRPVAVTP